MTELPGPGEDFANWTATQWGSLVPEVDSTAAAVAIKFMRVATALGHSHARVIRPWKDQGVTTIDDFRTLGLLRHIGDSGIRPQYIADQLNADPGTISSRLSRLEKHGLVERFADPIDGRARLVRLQPSREGLIDAIYRALVDNHERFFQQLSTDEHHDLSSLLGRLSF